MDITKMGTLQIPIKHKFNEGYEQYDFEEPIFVRSPLILRVEPKIEELAGMPKFGVIGLHTRPYRAYSEISGLARVMQGVRKLFKVKDMLIMGDLNAGKSFFGKTDLALSFLPEEVDAEKPVEAGPGAQKYKYHDHWLIARNTQTTAKRYKRPDDGSDNRGNQENKQEQLQPSVRMDKGPFHNSKFVHPPAADGRTAIIALDRSVGLGQVKYNCIQCHGLRIPRSLHVLL